MAPLDPASAPPPAPTPHTLPTVAGVSQALLSAWGTYKLAGFFGLAGEGAIIVGGVVASVLTSLFHRIAQRQHWGR